MSEKSIVISKESIYLNNGMNSRILKNSQQNTFKAKVGEHYRIIKRKAGRDEMLDNVIAKRVGDDLLLQYEDDTKVTLEDYYKECKAALECDLTLPSKDGEIYSLSGENVTGAPLGDGSTLVYAHGSHDILMGMAKGNSLIEGILSKLEGLQLTYIPTESTLDRIKALGYWGLGGLAAVAAAEAGIGAGLSGEGSNNDAPPKDTTAPAAPAAILNPLSDSGTLGDSITSDTTPTISGSGATAGDTITLYAPNGTTVLGTVVVAANGTWAITPTTTLPEGSNNLRVTATDPAGNTSAHTAILINIVADLIIDGHVTAGPIFAGITLYAYDNTSNLLGSSAIDANGHYVITVINGSSYTSSILVKAVDSNATSSNYLDEVTGSNKSLNTDLRAFAVAGASNTTSYTHVANSDATLQVNLSIVSELAVRHAGVTTDAAPASVSIVTDANAGVATALGLNGIDVVGNAPTTTNSATFNGADKLSASEKIGLVLAKLSGLDSLNGGNICTSLYLTRSRMRIFQIVGILDLKVFLLVP